jgi:hypothetical protein
MVIAMLLAHLVGDYVLQWDGLAEWKSRELQGVLVHSAIVAVVTAAFALPINPDWWGGILLISISHLIIDGLQFYFRPTISPLLRFILDQIAHLFFIILALVLTGYLAWGDLWVGIVASARATPMLTALLGYAFITMPAWVLLKFVIYALVKGQPPNFPAGPNKFVGITERVLITTLVLSGQALLVPLVTLPRLIVEWPRVVKGGADVIYLTELVSSVGLAVGVGVGLSALAI